MKLTKSHYLKIISSFKRNKHAFINNLIEVKGLIRDLNNILPNKEYIEITDLFDFYTKEIDNALFIELSLDAINKLMDYLEKNNNSFKRLNFFNTFSEEVMKI